MQAMARYVRREVSCLSLTGIHYFTFSKNELSVHQIYQIHTYIGSNLNKLTKLYSKRIRVVTPCILHAIEQFILFGFHIMKNFVVFALLVRMIVEVSNTLVLLIPLHHLALNFQVILYG